MENSNCGKKFIFIKKRKGTRYVYAFLPATCKSWSCSTCRPVKADVVKDFIRTSFEEKPLWMLSITFFHSGTALEAWEAIGKNCNRMLTYARKYSGAFNYVRVVEPHKDGNWPHIHLLVDKPIAGTNFVKKVTDWGFGWNFHSKRMSAVAASNYVSKYLTKAWPDGDGDIYRIMTKTRIVTSSRVLGPIFKQHSSWELVEFDRPKEMLAFFRACMVNELHKNGASFVQVSPFGTGFICESDVSCSDMFLESIIEPWVWDIPEEGRYIHAPYGVQEELPF